MASLTQEQREDLSKQVSNGKGCGENISYLQHLVLPLCRGGNKWSVTFLPSLHVVLLLTKTRKTVSKCWFPPPTRKSNFESSFVAVELYSDKKYIKFSVTPHFTGEVEDSCHPTSHTSKFQATCQDREQRANKFVNNVTLEQETGVLRELML